MFIYTGVRKVSKGDVIKIIDKLFLIVDDGECLLLVDKEFGLHGVDSMYYQEFKDNNFVYQGSFKYNGE